MWPKLHEILMLNSSGFFLSLILMKNLRPRSKHFWGPFFFGACGPPPRAGRPPGSQTRARFSLAFFQRKTKAFSRAWRPAARPADPPAARAFFGGPFLAPRTETPAVWAAGARAEFLVFQIRIQSTEERV